MTRALVAAIISGWFAIERPGCYFSDDGEHDYAVIDGHYDLNELADLILSEAEGLTSPPAKAQDGPDSGSFLGS